LDILQWHSILSAEILPEEEELKFTDKNVWPLKYGFKRYISDKQKLMTQNAICWKLWSITSQIK
jgi:hypothetical protein